MHSWKEFGTRDGKCHMQMCQSNIAIFSQKTQFFFSVKSLNLETAELIIIPENKEKGNKK